VIKLDVQKIKAVLFNPVEVWERKARDGKWEQAMMVTFTYLDLETGFLVQQKLTQSAYDALEIPATALTASPVTKLPTVELTYAYEGDGNYLKRILKSVKVDKALKVV